MPNGNGNGKERTPQTRIEAIVVGLKPMIAVISVVATFATYSAWELNKIKSAVQENANDRWSRTNMLELCRQLEDLNNGFKCPVNLPTYSKPDSVFSEALQKYRRVAKTDYLRVK